MVRLPQCRKVYVSVNIDVEKDGSVRPRMIRWEDGHIYEIDRLKHRDAKLRLSRSAVMASDILSQSAERILSYMMKTVNGL
jgi:hypothetical protein